MEFKNPTKTHKNPHVKYLSFLIEKCENLAYPDLVVLSKCPIWAKGMLGKRYINVEKAIKKVAKLRQKDLSFREIARVLKKDLKTLAAV